MIVDKKLQNIQTITIEELSSLFSEADAIETKEDVSGFVVHKVITNKGICTILPSPNEQLFFMIPE